MSTDDVIGGGEYMMAVAKALDMPERGITSLSISVDFPGPVIVRLVYVREGTPALLDVLPPRELSNLEPTP